MPSSPSLFLKTLRGEAAAIPPIWFMRQAGRYLPEYRRLRAEAGSFLDLCYTPALATEVTLQPISRFDLDAAILFADILLVPDALGVDVAFREGEGPVLSAVKNAEDVKALSVDNIISHLAPVFETVAGVRAKLPKDRALIGFAGAPWTVATYMLAGRGVKDPAALRLFAYQHPGAFGDLIDKLVDATALYLIAQIEAGADCVKLFDSWAGGLPEHFFKTACFDPTLRIIEMIKDRFPATPVIAFPKGSGVSMTQYAEAPSIDAVAIDSSVSADWARATISPHAVVQGGLDPLLVVAGTDALEQAAQHYCAAFKDVPYIFNLGHGFVPQTPIAHVERVITSVREGQFEGRNK